MYSLGLREKCLLVSLCYFCKFLKFNLFKRCNFTNYLCIFSSVISQIKQLRAKFGSGEDDMHDDDEEEEEDYKLTWGGKKFSHGAENRNFEVRI